MTGCPDCMKKVKDGPGIPDLAAYILQIDEQLGHLLRQIFVFAVQGCG